MDNLLMSSIKRSGVGVGYNTDEALQNWLATDPALNAEGLNYGHEALDSTEPILVETIKKPRHAKRVHTESYPQRGARKFATAYKVVSTVSGESVEWITGTTGLISNSKSHFTRQGAALQAAKQLAKRTHQAYEIMVDKVLVDGNLLVAQVRPGKSSPGEFKFTASFKY